MTVDKMTDLEIPTLEEIRTTRAHIDPYVLRTPMWRWQSQAVEEAFGADTEVWLKLELFQRTGTFKPRGAVNDILQLDEEARARGVTAVSAGNHAIAVAYAAQIFGISAKGRDAFVRAPVPGGEVAQLWGRGCAGGRRI